jgi:hypothetical protein
MPLIGPFKTREEALAACGASSSSSSSSTCPAIAGWGGAGYYCVTVGSACVPVELLDSDKCDTSIVICSGPYATLDEATAVCPTPGTSCSAGGLLTVDTTVGNTIFGATTGDFWHFPVTPGDVYNFDLSTLAGGGHGVLSYSLQFFANADCTGTSRFGGSGGASGVCTNFTPIVIPDDFHCLCINVTYGFPAGSIDSVTYSLTFHSGSC